MYFWSNSLSLIYHDPISDLTDKPNRNGIESESGKESKGDINISVRAITKYVPVFCLHV